MTKTKLKILLEDRVLIVADAPASCTLGGILLPDVAKEKARRGTVIAVGPGKIAELTGQRIPMTVQTGDRVMFHVYSGQEAKIDSESYGYAKEMELRIMMEREILYVFEEVEE